MEFAAVYSCTRLTPTFLRRLDCVSASKVPAFSSGPSSTWTEAPFFPATKLSLEVGHAASQGNALHALLTRDTIRLAPVAHLLPNG